MMSISFSVVIISITFTSITFIGEAVYENIKLPQIYHHLNVQYFPKSKKAIIFLGI